MHRQTPPLRIRLIGAPCDAGAGIRGGRLGPDALRVAGLVPALVALGAEVSDAGNLAGPAAPAPAACDPIHHLPEVTAWNRAVRDATGEALARGQLPVLLGGDHSLAIGSLSAVARHCRKRRQALRVLWLDAHADANTADLTPSGNLHGMPVACLCGHGPAALCELSGTRPALAPTAFRHVGVRSVDEGERQFLRQLGLQVFDMRHIDEYGMRATMTSALAGLTPDTHLHVSLDLDLLDPDIAPGVGTPVRGGPTYREAQLCMEMIADSGCLASLDVVELNPALDERNRTAELAVELMASLFGKRTLAR